MRLLETIMIENNGNMISIPKGTVIREMYKDETYCLKNGDMNTISPEQAAELVYSTVLNDGYNRVAIYVGECDMGGGTPSVELVFENGAYQGASTYGGNDVSEKCLEIFQPYEGEQIAGVFEGQLVREDFIALVDMFQQCLDNINTI